MEDFGKGEGGRKNSWLIIHSSTMANNFRILSLFYSLISVVIIFTAQNKKQISPFFHFENI